MKPVVYLIFQRYKFKSKSQPIPKMATTACRCIWYFKDTNSKANHNKARDVMEFRWGVFDISKIQIQKQITTRSKLRKTTEKVYLIFQRYKFKSKSQQVEMKAFTKKGVFDISKIQIQKQITTNTIISISRIRVYLIFQRYKFKSKSQLYRCSAYATPWCIWYFKDTNSKANHNS